LRNFKFLNIFLRTWYKLFFSVGRRVCY